MTEEQYKRASRLAYIVAMIILVYMGLIFAGALLMGNRTPNVIIQICAVIPGVILASIGYFAYRERKLGSILIVCGPTLVYFVAMCLNSTPTTFVNSFPIMFASMVYLNLKMMCIGDAIVVLGTIINLARLYSAGIVDIQFAFVEGMITILCVVASIVAASIISGFNKANLASIEEKANDQMEKAKHMTRTAEQLMENFEKADTYIERVGQCITTNNFSMENIAQSTESTAEAIQQQAAMCSEITQNTQAAEAQIQTMLAAADRTLKTVTEGVAIIRDLQTQSEIVNEASRTTVRSTNELTRKITEVESFTSAILSISGQTNLLALNASIEAARAGDAGRGFAVVADEIRQLSEQTKDSVNQITEIINSLNEFAKGANQSVEDAIHSVEKQTDMIATSQEKFNLISDEVSSLTQIVEKTEDVMKEIFKDTDIISDNIGHLSATSEEVAASSTEGLNTSQEAVNAMNEVQRTLEALHDVANALKGMAGV